MALSFRDFYFCYSPRQHDFLAGKGFEYITTGRHIATYRQFWQYESTNELNDALREFINLKMEAMYA